MQIEEKLTEAIRESIYITQIDKRLQQKVHPDWFVANGQMFTFGVDMDKIKQILKDAARLGNNYEQYAGKLMTNTEWLERFLNELEYTPNGSGNFGEKIYKDNDIMRAARKASGVE